MEEQQHEISVKAVCAESPNTHTSLNNTDFKSKIKIWLIFPDKGRRTVIRAACVLFIVTGNISEDCQILSKTQPSAVRLFNNKF